MRYIPAFFLASLAWSAPPAAAPSAPVYDRTIATYTAERIPKWLKLSGEFRTRAEGRTGFNFQPGNDDAYGLFRVRFNVQLLPTRWMEGFFQGQDARVAGMDPGRPLGIFKNPADVRQAYIRLGAPNGPVKLTVGRQLLNYGAQRILGPLDWTNTSRNWDAVKLELGNADAKVDLFASTVVVPDATRRIDQPRRGQNIHGAYGTLRKLVPHSSLEPYVLWRTGNQSVWSGGFRLASLPGDPKLHGFDYQIETIQQWGSFGRLDHRAWAASFVAGRTLTASGWKPRVSAEYNTASGDDNPSDGRRTTFDHLLGTNHLFYGVADIIGWQNMHHVRVGADAKPHKRLQVNADCHRYWLANPNDALYGVNGQASVRPKAGNTARSVGTELDFTFLWTASTQWKLGGGVGHLFAGEFLKRNSAGSGQTFPYVFAQYSF